MIKYKYPLNKLHNYFLNYNEITKDTEYTLFDIDAKELITANRIDLVVKYYYIECREKNNNFEFAKELYIKHIEAFSDGTFSEQGNSNKNSIEKYLQVFNSLIDDFKINGYKEDISIIPIGKNYALLDGSHRTACAAYFNQKIKVIQFNHLFVDYGFNFFRKRLLDDIYLDFISTKYIILKDNIYVLFVWPKITKHKDNKMVYEILNDKCNIIYNRKFKMESKEFGNLLYHVYKDEHWIGYKKNSFKGLTKKTEQCYDKNGLVEIFLVDCTYVEILTKIKEELRNLFEIGKDSIHSTDTKKETIEILNYIFAEKYKGNFIDNLKYDRVKYIGRKIRYMYRVIINQIKYMIGKPI
jgi:hypothetical protein